MKGLFVDTAGWVACTDTAEPAHKRATAARDRWLEAGGVLVTTDYVADETLTLLRMRLGLDVAEAWWHRWMAVRVCAGSSSACARADKARGMFFRYTDKDFSFTDCTSFVVMRELKLREALTTDHHFAQAGFITLPK